MDENAKPVLVIGGGIAGVTSAIEAAEAGCRVVLLEKSPYLGGRVARMYRYFPKLCPPTCGLEINFKRIQNNPNILILNETSYTGRMNWTKFAYQPASDKKLMIIR